MKGVLRLALSLLLGTALLIGSRGITPVAADTYQTTASTAFVGTWHSTPTTSGQTTPDAQYQESVPTPLGTTRPALPTGAGASLPQTGDDHTTAAGLALLGWGMIIGLLMSQRRQWGSRKKEFDK
ncbi:hypothetical protein ACFQ5J_11850 [Lacticaseibacillus baoqingensis]|uniref:LPXTG cell wall anchor domain-containing protein n=1 Tax=Lacticaseibacillus baoqingensis TaxID=2486013 RepID=A0ABW4EB52_9LACO|nr:hypothetical protein [Lacticaseibacillus baoqingensis]